MSLQESWRKTIPHLKLSANQIEVARGFSLVAMSDDTLRFTTAQPVTKSNADKLALALFQYLSRPVAVVLTRLPHGVQFRSFKDQEGNQP